MAKEKEAEGVKFYPSHTRYNPNGNYYLWIYLKPYSVEYTKPSMSNGIISNISTKPLGGTLAFLAPMELMDNVNHTWESQENIITKLLGTVGSAKQALSLDTEAHQVNTALVYRSSDRRKVDLTLNLSVYEDAYKDVVEPVNILRIHSAPSFSQKRGIGTKVDLPTVFKIQTKYCSKEVPLINFRHAVLTSVQPTFKGPYLQGYPSHCEMTLSFADMEHLSKRSFSEYGKVSVS